MGRVIRGRLDFLRMVQGPGSGTYRRMWNKLHEADPRYARHKLHIRPVGLENGQPDRAWQYWSQEYRDSVLMVEVDVAGRKLIGSAFFIKKGIVASCAHVIDAGTPTLYVDSSPQVVEKSRVKRHMHIDKGVDAVLIEPRLPSGPSPRWISVRKDPVQAGELVAALGYPDVPGTEPALGLFSGAVITTSKSYREIELIVVSARSSGGMSGGPVIDRGGHLIGIVVEKTFEMTAEGVPSEPFHLVLPARYLDEIQ